MKHWSSFQGEVTPLEHILYNNHQAGIN